MQYVSKYIVHNTQQQEDDEEKHINRKLNHEPQPHQSEQSGANSLNKQAIMDAALKYVKWWLYSALIMARQYNLSAKMAHTNQWRVGIINAEQRPHTPPPAEEGT